MTPLTSAVRRTLITVSILAILLLGFSVFDPSSDASTASSLAQLVLLALLAAGVIPGSYLHRMAHSLAKQLEPRHKPAITLLATLGPLLFVVVLGLGIYNALDTLRFIGQFNGRTFDESAPRYDILRFGVLGLVSLRLFIMNLMNVAERNSQHEARG